MSSYKNKVCLCYLKIQHKKQPFVKTWASSNKTLHVGELQETQSPWLFSANLTVRCYSLLHPFSAGRSLQRNNQLVKPSLLSAACSLTQVRAKYYQQKQGFCSRSRRKFLGTNRLRKSEWMVDVSFWWQAREVFFFLSDKIFFLRTHHNSNVTLFLFACCSPY